MSRIAQRQPRRLRHTEQRDSLSRAEWGPHPKMQPTISGECILVDIVHMLRTVRRRVCARAATDAHCNQKRVCSCHTWRHPQPARGPFAQTDAAHREASESSVSNACDDEMPPSLQVRRRRRTPDQLDDHATGHGGHRAPNDVRHHRRETPTDGRKSSYAHCMTVSCASTTDRSSSSRDGITTARTNASADAGCGPAHSASDKCTRVASELCESGGTRSAHRHSIPARPGGGTKTAPDAQAPGAPPLATATQQHVGEEIARRSQPPTRQSSPALGSPTTRGDNGAQRAQTRRTSATQACTSQARGAAPLPTAPFSKTAVTRGNNWTSGTTAPTSSALARTHPCGGASQVSARMTGSTAATNSKLDNGLPYETTRHRPGYLVRAPLHAPYDAVADIEFPTKLRKSSEKPSASRTNFMYECDNEGRASTKSKSKKTSNPGKDAAGAGDEPMMLCRRLNWRAGPKSRAATAATKLPSRFCNANANNLLGVLCFSLRHSSQTRNQHRRRQGHGRASPLSSLATPGTELRPVPARGPDAESRDLCTTLNMTVGRRAAVKSHRTA